MKNSTSPLVGAVRILVKADDGITLPQQSFGVRIALRFVAERATHDSDNFVTATIEVLSQRRFERLPSGVAPVMVWEYQRDLQGPRLFRWSAETS